MMNRTKWLLVAGLVGSGFAVANEQNRGAMVDEGNQQQMGQSQDQAQPKSDYDKNRDISNGQGYGGAGAGGVTGSGHPTAGMEKEHREDKSMGGSGMTTGQDTTGKDMTGKDMTGKDMTGKDMKMGQGMATGQVDPQLSTALTKVHATNLSEIQMAQLAKDRAQSKDVKKLAEHILKDHQAADKRVEEHARMFNVNLQMAMTDPELQQMQKESQEHLTQLQGLKGAEFDKQFLLINLQAHEKAVAMVTEADNMFRDRKEGKIFGELLPKLKMHREHVQKVMDKGPNRAARRGTSMER
jgi:putative membrane protein